MLCCCIFQGRLALDLSGNECLDQVVGMLIVVLDWWRLQEVARRRQNGSADLGGTGRIDAHTGRVRRLPDFQLVASGACGKYRRQT